MQNQKIEVIFEQVKKEIKSENLNVSSASILLLLDVLRNNRQIKDDNKNEESVAENISKKNLKTGNISSRLDSISDVLNS